MPPEVKSLVKSVISVWSSAKASLHSAATRSSNISICSCIFFSTLLLSVDFLRYAIRKPMKTIKTMTLTAITMNRVGFVNEALSPCGEEYDKLPMLYFKDPPTMTTTSGKDSVSSPSSPRALGWFSGGRHVNCCLDKEVTLQKLLPILTSTSDSWHARSIFCPWNKYLFIPMQN